LIERFLDQEKRADFGGASDLGDLVYDLLLGIGSIGRAQTFHRLLLV
jgi:hypothetical protein